MSFFSKVKKAFKSIASIVTAPLKVVAQAAAKVIAPVIKLVAEVEGLVYNGLKQVTDAVSIGPSFIRNLASRLSGLAYDSAMFSSRAQLGVGLLALGYASGDRDLKTEGRIELLTASLYFMRANGAVPQWLMMIVMIVVAIFFPWVAVIVMLVYVGVFLAVKFEVPKLEDDPDALLKRLLLLSKYGLLDDESNALLAQYAAEKSKTPLYDETVPGPYGPGVDSEYIDITDVLENIKDQLTKPGPGDGGTFDPGDTTPPVADQSSGSSSNTIVLLMVAIGIGALMSRIS